MDLKNYFNIARRNERRNKATRPETVRFFMSVLTFSVPWFGGINIKFAYGILTDLSWLRVLSFVSLFVVVGEEWKCSNHKNVYLLRYCGIILRKTRPNARVGVRGSRWMHVRKVFVRFSVLQHEQQNCFCFFVSPLLLLCYPPWLQVSFNIF